MASPRGRGLRPGGIVRAVVRLVLLVAVGFGVGLVFGLVTEEPELIAGHLRGEGEAVPLSATPEGAAAGPDAATPEGAAAGPDAATGQEVYASAAMDPRPMVEPAEREAAASLPRVAAPVPKAVPAATPVVKGVPAAPRRATPVEVAGPVPDTARRAAKVQKAARPWSIQVGAFSEKRAARRLAETLSGGYPVEVLPATRDGGRWRVRVQPIATEDRARATAEKLKREEGLPTWVTPMDDGRGSAEGRSG